ncbi:MAG: hypothetical protein PHC94_13055 [Methylobacter sp.]|nr:hypothetical protein [Methylobacter sp.]
MNEKPKPTGTDVLDSTNNALHAVQHILCPANHNRSSLTLRYEAEKQHSAEMEFGWYSAVGRLSFKDVLREVFLTEKHPDQQKPAAFNECSRLFLAKCTQFVWLDYRVLPRDFIGVF